jgi:hypothetical protein
MEFKSHESNCVGFLILFSTFLGNFTLYALRLEPRFKQKGVLENGFKYFPTPKKSRKSTQ